MLRGGVSDSLAAETEALDDLLVSLGSGVLEVIKVAAAKRDKLEQTAAGREVLLVAAEVAGEMKNARGKARDLVVSTAGIVRVLFVRVGIDGCLAHFPLGKFQQLQSS